MTLRPCLVCGEPCDGARCTAHTVDTQPAASVRGYDWAWTKLSKQARKLQPFCSDCGGTEGLQCDHSPEAWRRKAQGKPIRLCDVDVVCPRCNTRRGAARADAPRASLPDRHGGQSLCYSPGQAAKCQ